MIRLEGQFHLPRQSKTLSAWISCFEDGKMNLVCPEAAIDITYSREQFQLGDYLPGLPLTISFPDDSVFTPILEQQDTFKKWSKPLRKGKIIEWFEHSFKALVISIVALPLIIISFYHWGIPVLAHGSAAIIPYVLQKQVGDETLIIVEKLYLSESELPKEIQASIEGSWRDHLSALKVEHREDFTLLFRQSEVFKNNAFALPNRTIVITDSLINTLDKSQHEILSILLHETGHLVHKHGVKKILEAAYVSFATTMLLGDIETMGDIFVSVGSGIVNSAFSRDMEREADKFAIEGLKELNIKPAVFSKAMQKIVGRHNESHKPSVFEKFIALFNSHPDTEERVKAAQ